MGSSCCGDRSDFPSNSPAKSQKMTKEAASYIESEEAKNLHLKSIDSIRTLTGTLQDHYKFTTSIRKDSYANTWHCVEKSTGLKYIIKEFQSNSSKKTKKTVEKLPQEAQIWRQMDHPNVIRMLEVMKDRGVVYGLGEDCQGQDFSQYLQLHPKLSDSEAVPLMQQVLSLLHQVHKKGILLRNMRPNSFLIVKTRDLELKLLHFGDACFGSRKSERVLDLESEFVAPEVRGEGSYNEKCDIWSAGMVLLCMLTGKVWTNPREVVRDLKKRKVLSAQASDLIGKMTENQLEMRPSASECMHHIYLKTSSEAPSVSLLTRMTTNIKEKGPPEALKQCVLTFICSRVMGFEEFEEVKTLFTKLDGNGDGRISKSEFLSGIQEITKQPASEIKEILSQLDVDQSGLIEYSEFLVMTANNSKLLTKKNLQIAFRGLDSDNNGSISISELREKLEMDGESAEAWERYMSAIDRSGDGEISYQEFESWMMGICA